jgi:hypothetical protein
MKKKKNKKIQKSKILNFNFKNLGNDITEYPFVEIKWLDIEGDSGWQDTKTLKNSKLPTCVFIHLNGPLLTHQGPCTL